MSDNNLKTEINNIFNDAIGDGSMIRNAIQENLKTAINEAVADAFKWGDIRKMIDKKIKETMVPAIESSDFSVYLPRLDTMLSAMAKDPSIMANRRILENFKTVVYPPEEKVISIENIFKKYCKFVAESLDTDGRDVSYDDGVYYEDINCIMETEDIRSQYERSGNEKWQISFHTEEDDAKSMYGESLDMSVILYRYSWYDRGEYSIMMAMDPSITSLGNMSDFEAYMLSLVTAGVRIKFEHTPEYECFEESVTPETEPEASYY